MSSILVVEVEGAISRVLNDELGSEEYQTVKVLNGDDAVQFALREIPRLIIFDLTLPYLNGHELIRQVREHPKCMHIPIIALGSHSLVAYKVRVLEAGADNYLVNSSPGARLSAETSAELLAFAFDALARRSAARTSHRLQIEQRQSMEHSVP